MIDSLTKAHNKTTAPQLPSAECNRLIFQFVFESSANHDQFAFTKHVFDDQSVSVEEDLAKYDEECKKENASLPRMT